MRTYPSPSVHAALVPVAALFAARVGLFAARASWRALGALRPRFGCCSCAGAAGDEADAAVDIQAEELCDDDDCCGDAGRSAAEQWVPCSEPAPPPPEDSRLVAAAHLPISVYCFYEQFVSLDTSRMQEHHRASGQYEFKCSRWRPARSSASASASASAGVFSRTLDFMQPKRGLCSVSAHCVQAQRFSVHAGGVLVLATDMRMEHIPYADCFRVQSFWTVAPDASGRGCDVCVRVAVPFDKRCLVKSIISGATLKDCEAFYASFLAKAQRAIALGLPPAAAPAPAAPAAAAQPPARCAAQPARLPAPLSPAAAANQPSAAATNQPSAAAADQPSAAAADQPSAAAAAGADSDGGVQGQLPPSPLWRECGPVDAEVFVSATWPGAGNAPSPQKAQQQQQQQRRQQQQGQQWAGTGQCSKAPALQQQRRRHWGWLLWLLRRAQQQHPGQRGQQSWPAQQRQQKQQQQPRQWPGAAPRSTGQSVAGDPPAAGHEVHRRTRGMDLLTTAQAALLLLVLLVQVVTLYDNMALRRVLAAGAPLGLTAGGG